MNCNRVRYGRLLFSVVLFGALLVSSELRAQVGTLARPFPQSSPNAALRYQRALLLMSALDDVDHKLLQQNVWEVLPDLKPTGGQGNRIKRLLYRARHAANAAAAGSRMETCDFGIDFAESGAGTILPHAKPMVELGRLLTLRGAYAQSQGRWDEAAVIYFDGLRLGRHLTHQPTLVEAIAGMQILENNFYALAHWAVACPDSDLVTRAFGLFEIIADELIRPATTLACETDLLAIDFQILEQSFPDGPWGTVILQSLGEEVVEDEKQNRKAAVAACVKAGVPGKVFSDADSFRRYVGRLKELDLRFAEAAASCMKLPPKARVERGQRLYERYSKAAGAIGASTLLNPAEIGALFAAHEAKATVLRVTLAVAARRGETEFPARLNDVAGGFGGKVPVSPYDDTQLEYELLDEGQSFRLAIGALRVGDQVLPSVEFASAAPAPVSQ